MSVTNVYNNIVKNYAWDDAYEQAYAALYNAKYNTRLQYYLNLDPDDTSAAQKAAADAKAEADARAPIEAQNACASLLTSFSKSIGADSVADVTSDPQYISQFTDYMQRVYTGITLAGSQSPLEVQKRSITDIIVEMTISLIETLQNTLAVTCATQDALGVQRGQAILSSQMQKMYSDLTTRIPILSGSETNAWNLGTSSSAIQINPNTTILNGKSLAALAAQIADTTQSSTITTQLQYTSGSYTFPIRIQNTFSPPQWYGDYWGVCESGNNRMFNNTFNIILDRDAGIVKLQLDTSLTLTGSPSGMTHWTATITSQTVNEKTSSASWQAALQALFASFNTSKTYDVVADQNNRNAGKVIVGMDATGKIDIRVRNMWPSDDWLYPGHVADAVTYSGDASGCYYPPITVPQGYSWYSTVNLPAVTDANLLSTATVQPYYDPSWSISQTTQSYINPSSVSFGFSGITASDIAQYMSVGATTTNFDIALRDSTGREIATTSPISFTYNDGSREWFGGYDGFLRTTLSLRFVKGQGVSIVATSKLYKFPDGGRTDYNGQNDDNPIRTSDADEMNPYSSIYIDSHVINNATQESTFWLDQSQPNSSQDWALSIQNALRKLINSDPPATATSPLTANSYTFSQTTSAYSSLNAVSSASGTGHSTLWYTVVDGKLTMYFKPYLEQMVPANFSWNGHEVRALQGSSTAIYGENPGTFCIPWPYPAPKLPANATEQQQKDYQKAAEAASSSRSTSNMQLQQYITTLKAKRQILQDQSLALQTVIGAAKSGMNQMTDLASSILSNIYTISKNIFK